MPDATIRCWREGDDESLLALWAPIGWTDASRYGAKFEDPDNSPDRVFVAELGGRVVGHVISTRRKLLVDGDWREFAGVGHLVVHPAARGLRLGRRLLDTCRGVAERDGARGLVMWTSPTFVPAYEMYLRDGYRFISRHVRHRVDPEWLLERLPEEPVLERRPLAADDWPAVRDLRARWAREAFPVSLGWDAEREFGSSAYTGLYSDGSLIGAFSEALTDPIVAPGLVRAALRAMADALLADGRSSAVFSVGLGGLADEALSPLSHLREENGYCTLIKPLGTPLQITAPQRVHAFVWPW